jgi:SAM-dependent methyltransferase
MKRFDSRIKNFGYLLYRLTSPVLDPIRFLRGLYGYGWFIADMARYKIKDRAARISAADIYPILDEKTPLTRFDAQYFHQQLWLFEDVLKRKPKNHVDIGSTYQMSGYLSKIVPTTFVDIRPIDTRLPNLEIRKGDILHLPFADGSLESLSCLHVVEHIGLGRYGDAIDPEGSKKACKELGRVLAPGGILYFSVPIGRPRLCFNAHRIFSIGQVTDFFPGLRIEEFSVVDDEGIFHAHTARSVAAQMNYGLGLFIFRKSDE